MVCAQFWCRFLGTFVFYFQILFPKDIELLKNPPHKACWPFFSKFASVKFQYK
jgi:hypothetical protein